MTREFAADGVIIKDNKVLLVKRGSPPGVGEWAIPGGRINYDEDAVGCLKREMKEETNLEVEPLAFVGVYSDPKREPRQVITAAYLCKIKGGEVKHGDDAADAQWFSLTAMPKLWADHGKIMNDALLLLKKKIIFPVQ